jgi:hypothetical protein
VTGHTIAQVNAGNAHGQQLAVAARSTPQHDSKLVEVREPEVSMVPKKKKSKVVPGGTLTTGGSSK